MKHIKAFDKLYEYRSQETKSDEVKKESDNIQNEEEAVELYRDLIKRIKMNIYPIEYFDKKMKQIEVKYGEIKNTIRLDAINKLDAKRKKDKDDEIVAAYRKVIDDINSGYFTIKRLEEKINNVRARYRKIDSDVERDIRKETLEVFRKYKENYKE